MEEKEVHLVKKVSKELGLTYKELGEKIGYSESILRQSVSKNKISSQLKRALELYQETVKLKEEKKETEEIKKLIKTFFK
ncbi:hypothetical protein MNB_SV-14-446 [hydrothermal vent metagenome]|uniref:Rho-GAP domain-containing protein n=1 Tax=hydrothermal vent metagenome TaxID=652676 RepID=A0A1W1BQC6_9ZZZZ